MHPFASPPMLKLHIDKRMDRALHSNQQGDDFETAVSIYHPPPQLHIETAIHFHASRLILPAPGTVRIRLLWSVWMLAATLATN
jgi:hypothetical protein